ncbi:tetratricopeptide repeat protein [Candidatus Micrarchaeota archaeon]|nr:tetratricopeptide repeat protein [Candidatus Micrarchaeota archaeon]
MKDELLEGMIGKCEEFYHAGSYARSLAEADDILRQDGKVGIAWYFKGMSLYHLENYAEAVSAFDKAIECEPDDGLNYYGRGISHYSLGDYEKAVPDFSKSLELDDADVDAAFMLYRCYSDEGEDEKAGQQLEDSFSIDPHKTVELLEEYFEEFVLFESEPSAEEKVEKMKQIVEFKKRLPEQDNSHPSSSKSGEIMKFIAKKDEPI